MANDTSISIDAHPIIEAAKAFEAEREKAFVSMATTAKAAINYGKLLEDAREKLGSAKALEKWLIVTIPTMPIQDSESCMKVAAKYAREGDGLFLQRAGAAWAQAELGLLPPPPVKPEKPRTPYTPADALEMIEKCKRGLAEVFTDAPLAGWDDAERTLLHTALAELDLIGGDK